MQRRRRRRPLTRTRSCCDATGVDFPSTTTIGPPLDARTAGGGAVAHSSMDIPNDRLEKVERGGVGVVVAVLGLVVVAAWWCCSDGCTKRGFCLGGGATGSGLLINP